MVKFTIQFCVVWNYRPRAAGLAVELQGEFPGSDVRLIESSGGLFEVTMDGRLLFSKQALGRHAQPGEVVRLAREALG